MFVCLSVCAQTYRNNHTCILHQISCTCWMWPWLGCPLAALKYTAYTPGLWTRSIWKMLGSFATASRLTPIHQVSLGVLSRAASASMSTMTTTTTTATTTTRDRGDRYGPMEWAQWRHIFPWRSQWEYDATAMSNTPAIRGTGVGLFQTTAVSAKTRRVLRGEGVWGEVCDAPLLCCTYDDVIYRLRQ